jgi:hypothetical protein
VAAAVPTPAATPFSAPVTANPFAKIQLAPSSGAPKFNFAAAEAKPPTVAQADSTTPAAAVKPIVFNFGASDKSKATSTTTETTAAAEKPNLFAFATKVASDATPAAADAKEKPKLSFGFPPQTTTAASTTTATPKPSFGFGAGAKTATPAAADGNASKPMFGAVLPTPVATTTTTTTTPATASKPVLSFGFGAGAKAATPAPTSTPAAAEGGWKCAACTQPNDASAKQCSVCLSNKPAAATTTAAASTTTTTPASTATTTTTTTPATASKPVLSFGFGAGAKAATPAPTSTPAAAEGGWKCAACTQPNDASAKQCSVCLSNKPATAVAAPPPTTPAAKPAETESAKPTFSFGVVKPFEPVATNDASTLSSDQPAASSAKPTFNFGAPKSDAATPAATSAKPLFSFGAKPSDAAAATTASAEAAKPLFNFGGVTKPDAVAAAASTATPAAAKPIFNFGTATVSKAAEAAPTDGAKVTPFVFGGGAKPTTATVPPVETAPKAKPFQFAATSAPTADGAATTQPKPLFQFSTAKTSGGAETAATPAAVVAPIKFSFAGPSSATIGATKPADEDEGGGEEGGEAEPEEEPTEVKDQALPSDQTVAFEVRVRVLELASGAWADKGVGILKVITAPTFAYVLVRAEGVGRVMLNSRLHAKLTVSRPNPKAVACVLVGADAAPHSYTFRLQSAELAGSLVAAIEAAKTIGSDSTASTATAAPTKPVAAAAKPVAAATPAVAATPVQPVKAAAAVVAATPVAQKAKSPITSPAGQAAVPLTGEDGKPLSKGQRKRLRKQQQQQQQQQQHQAQDMDEDGSGSGDEDDTAPPTTGKRKQDDVDAVPVAAAAEEATLASNQPPAKRAMVGSAADASGRLSAAAPEFRPSFVNKPAAAVSTPAATPVAAVRASAATPVATPFRFDTASVLQGGGATAAATPAATRSTAFTTPATSRLTSLSAPPTPATPLTDTSGSALVAQLASQTAEMSADARGALAADARRLLELARAIAADDREAATTCITQWRGDNAPLCEYVRRKRGSLRDAAYDRLVRIVAPPSLRSLAGMAARAEPQAFAQLIEQFVGLL